MNTRLDETKKSLCVPVLFEKLGDDEGKVWCYRTLVAHKNMSSFKRKSVSNVGYHRNLVIRLLAGDGSDEMESMFNHDHKQQKGPKLASAVLYSIVESAKANGLKPYNYISYLQENFSQPEPDIEKLLPWRVNLG